MALRLAVEITGEAGGLREGVQAAGRGLDTLAERGQRMARQLRDSLEDAGRRMRDLGQTLSLAVTAPLAGLATLSVRTASDYQELRNLVAVTFGDATEDVEEWAARTAEEVQRSRMELLRAAGDFAAFLKPLGAAPDQIVPMSQALAQLVTDLSSFRNIAESEAFMALFSGLAGETEAVRRLGIDLGQAAVEAELLAMGIEEGASAATQGEKAVARYNLIMAQTTDAQGDAARTAGSFENQMRALGAATTDLRLVIGTALLPAATELVTMLSELARWLSGVNPELVALGVVAGGVGAAVGPLILGIGLLVTGLGALAGAVAAISAPLVVAGAGIAAFAALIVTQWDNIIADIERLKAAWSAFADFVNQPLSDIVAQSRNFLVDQLGSVWETVKSGLQAVRSAFVAVFGEELVAAFEAFHVQMFNIAVRMVAGLKDTIVGGLEWIRDRVKGVWEGVVGIFEWGQDVIVGNSIVPDMVEAVLAWFERLGQGMTAATGTATESVVGQFGSLRDGVDSTLAGLGSFATSPFQSIADAITGPFQDALTQGERGFANFGDRLIASANQMADRLINDAFKRINDSLVNLLSSGLGSVFGAGASAFPTTLAGAGVGNFSSAGQLTMFADGGVVTRPTLFPMARGAGLMAEEEPEAIMPLVRLPSGRLGVESAGGGGRGGGGGGGRQSADVNVTQNFYGYDRTQVRQSGVSAGRETGRAVRRAQRYG